MGFQAGILFVTYSHAVGTYAVVKPQRAPHVIVCCIFFVSSGCAAARTSFGAVENAEIDDIAPIAIPHP